MRIGLSVLTHAGQSIWENGIGQNVLFLADLLLSSPGIEKVVLLDCGDQGVMAPDAGSDPRLPLVPLRESEGLIDIAIEIAGGIDPEWIRRFRARGGKVVGYVCGQPYAGLIEPSVFGLPGYWADPDRCDELWVLPKDAGFAPMLRSIYRVPVHEMPYIWAPRLLRLAIGRDGAAFGYRHGALQPDHSMKVAIFEPNISPIKTGLISLLICERVERMSPRTLASVRLMNSAHLEGQPTFDFLKSSLDLNANGKLETAAREYFAVVMASQANCIVSHQLECVQNYLYLDAVFGDYPLIHNSDMFADIGYHYSKSDIEAGARQVLRAKSEHDHSLDAYRRRSKAAISRLDPANDANRSAYVRRLIALAAQRPVRERRR